MSYGAIVATNAAAAERRRRILLEKEEEEMIQYTPDELNNDWEFKIVRANAPVFRKPKEMDRLLEEEARAGWIMLEKLDDSRIRFKRPRRARAQDAYLPPDVDPYRTHYGTLPAQQTMIVLLIGGVTLGLFLLGILLFVLTLR